MPKNYTPNANFQLLLKCICLPKLTQNFLFMPSLVSAFCGKVEIVLEKSQVAFLSSCKNSENLLDDKNATYLSPKTITTLMFTVQIFREGHKNLSHLLRISKLQRLKVEIMKYLTPIVVCPLPNQASHKNCKILLFTRH